MVKKLIATTAGALFLLGQSAGAIAAPASADVAPRAASPVADAEGQWMGSDIFWIVLFILIALGIIVLVDDNKGNPDNAPVSP